VSGQIDPKRPLDQEIKSVLERLGGQSPRSDIHQPDFDKSWGTEIILGGGDKKLNLSVIQDLHTPGLLLTIWRIEKDCFPALEWVKFLEVEDVEICLFAAIAAVNTITPPPRVNRSQPRRKSQDNSATFAGDSSSWLILHSDNRQGVPSINLKLERRLNKAPDEIGTIPQDCLFAFIHSLQEGWYELLEAAELGGAE